MFDSCADPKSLEGLAWALCYLTTGKHLLFYGSFFVVLALMLIVAPIALAFGFGGAIAARSPILPLRLFGKAYTAMVRGIPDIVFFLFVPVAMDQGLEYLRYLYKCPHDGTPVWANNEFNVCAAAKLPLSTAPQIWHEVYGFFLAVIAFSIVFGAFAANVLYGAINALPNAQLETAEADGMTTEQDWVAQSRSENARLRHWLSEALAERGVPNDTSMANFVLARFGSEAEAEACDEFLKKDGLIVRRVASYGLPHCLRITVGDEPSCRRVAHMIGLFKAGASA